MTANLIIKATLLLKDALHSNVFNDM